MARSSIRTGNRLDVALLSACGVLSFVALILPPNLREPLASGMRRTIVSPLVAMQKRAELSRNALIAHDVAVAARDSVALRAMQYTAVQAENDRLRRLLGLGAGLKWGFVPAEALRGQGLGDEHTVTLTAGSGAGVRPFTPVIAPEGLVGMVQTVDPQLSLAILWTHPDFRVSAMDVDGTAFGIVAAHLALGADRYLLEMRGVPFRATLKPGTQIVSSGLGGVYPRGIPIGTVLSETRTAEGWARTYLLRPAILPADIGSVMVLLPQKVREGVQSVWQTSIAADSAVKSIVAGGDSIARAAAMAEAAARRAALDTVRSDSVRPRPSALRNDSTRRATSPTPSPTDTTRRPAATRRDTTARQPFNPFRDSFPAGPRDTTRRPPR